MPKGSGYARTRQRGETTHMARGGRGRILNPGNKHVCEGRAGGPQGSALKCIVFSIILDGILKETEQRRRVRTVVWFCFCELLITIFDPLKSF